MKKNWTDTLEQYIAGLHRQYRPKTVKRKTASLKAMFHYLEYRELFLSTIYKQYKNARTAYQKRNALRDAAVAELLFATGMRISELCSLKENNVNLYDGTILIYGKGSKERLIQIGNEAVISILAEYKNCFYSEIKSCNHELNRLSKHN